MGCSTIEIPNLHPGITLPASGDGYRIGTLDHSETRIPAKTWIMQRRRGIVLFSDDWALLKKTLSKHCIANECKQSIGALDALFATIDEALKKLPTR